MLASNKTELYYNVSMKTYRIYNMVWDIMKRPTYKGLATRKYIEECVRRDLPLPIALREVRASNDTEAKLIIEQMAGEKLRSWTVTFA